MNKNKKTPEKQAEKKILEQALERPDKIPPLKYVCLIR
jgi:hypothetical protein